MIMTSTRKLGLIKNEYKIENRLLNKAVKM